MRIHRSLGRHSRLRHLILQGASVLANASAPKAPNIESRLRVQFQRSLWSPLGEAAPCWLGLQSRSADATSSFRARVPEDKSAAIAGLTRTGTATKNQSINLKGIDDCARPQQKSHQKALGQCTKQKPVLSFRFQPGTTFPSGSRRIVMGETKEQRSLFFSFYLSICRTAAVLGGDRNERVCILPSAPLGAGAEICCVPAGVCLSVFLSVCGSSAAGPRVSLSLFRKFLSSL
jgi:hypothetical protein